MRGVNIDVILISQCLVSVHLQCLLMSLVAVGINRCYEKAVGIKITCSSTSENDDLLLGKV